MPASCRWASYATTPSHAAGQNDKDLYDFISKGIFQRQTQETDPMEIATKIVAMSFGPYTMAPNDINASGCV